MVKKNNKKSVAKKPMTRKASPIVFDLLDRFQKVLQRDNEESRVISARIWVDLQDHLLPWEHRKLTEAFSLFVRDDDLGQLRDSCAELVEGLERSVI